jgi:Beta-lactamase
VTSVRPVLTTAALLLLFLTPCASQDIHSAKVDDFVKAEMQKQRIPGVSLAVVKDGKIVLAKGYGFANLEHQVPVKPETIFQSGSVGKQFTATAVMMLVEAGPMLLSGGMRGEDTLEGRPAILDLPAGPGRVLAYNFNPMHRDLNRSDYRCSGTRY